MGARRGGQAVALLEDAVTRWRGAFAVASIAAPAALCAALVPVRASFAGSAAALVLVALVATVAILGDRVMGTLASLSSGLWFDFFLTRPYERFAITQRADIETTASLFAVGLIVTELAERSRRHRRQAVEAIDFVALIHDLGDLVARGAPSAVVVEQASGDLVRLLHLRDCRFAPDAPPANRPVVGQRGEVMHAGRRWGVSTLGLPEPEVDLPLRFAGQTVGRFVLVPTPGQLVASEHIIVAVAIAEQVAAGLATRARIA